MFPANTQEFEESGGEGGGLHRVLLGPLLGQLVVLVPEITEGTVYLRRSRYCSLTNTVGCQSGQKCLLFKIKVIEKMF